VVDVGEVAAAAGGDLVGRPGDEVERPRERVVCRGLVGAGVAEEDTAAAAVLDLPPGGRIVVVVGQAGEEGVAAADDGGEVRVGAAAEGREGGNAGFSQLVRMAGLGLGGGSAPQFHLP
jgi:hypothetical protein